MPTTTERRWYFDEVSRAILEKPDPNMPGQYCSTVVLKVPDEYRPEHAVWKQVVADGKLAAAAPRMLKILEGMEVSTTCPCSHCKNIVGLIREVGGYLGEK